MSTPTLRDRILETASQLFASQGFEQTSMRQIARASGCTAPAIYLHFKDKEALQFAAVQRAFERLARALDEATRFGPGALFRLQRVGWAYVEFGLEHPHPYKLMFMQRPHFLTQAPQDPHPPQLAEGRPGRLAPADVAGAAEVVGAAGAGEPGGGVEPGPARMGAFDALKRAVQEVAREEGVRFEEAELLRWCDTLWGGLHGIIALALVMPGFDRERTLGAAENFILSITGQLQRHVMARAR